MVFVLIVKNKGWNGIEEINWESYSYVRINNNKKVGNVEPSHRNQIIKLIKMAENVKHLQSNNKVN